MGLSPSGLSKRVDMLLTESAKMMYRVHSLAFQSAAQQVVSADRPVEGFDVACLICEGVFFSFIRRFSRVAAELRSLAGRKRGRTDHA